MTKNVTRLSWEDFKSLGNPENAPEDLEDEKMEEKTTDVLYVHYEKKGRGGKEALIIKGLSASDDRINEICKTIKSKLGVGGSAKDGEIIIQGNQRDKVIVILNGLGYKQVKKAGG